MDAWVYLFSKFSHEALLFEALGLFLGLFGYAIFYLIRKRKYGVAGKEVSSDVVKAYLAQLVGDAEEMRTQLFGLLGKGEATTRLMGHFQIPVDSNGTLASPSASSAPTAVAADPKLQERLRELERRLADQSTALDSVLNDKSKLEEELKNAKSSAASGASADASKGAGGGGAAANERLKQLEAQLAEYAIIEDDLANLKRLQKENKALKEQLAGMPAGAAPTAEPAAAAPVAETPATEAVNSQHADADHPADFESLVNVVEKNLADTAKSETVSASTTPAEQKTDGKTEEELQADFEKMLNS